MDFQEYPELAIKIYNGINRFAEDTKGGYFKRSLINASFCPYVEYLGERKNLMTGGPASMFYKEALKFSFDLNGKFLDHLATVYPEDPNIEYLISAYKVISYKTKITTGKTQRKTALHPAFFPFIDTVETLRRMSFLVMSTSWAEGNHLYFNSEWGQKFKDKSIVAMKLVETPYFDPLMLKDNEVFRESYENLKKQYFKGVDAARTSTAQALSKMGGLEDQADILSAIEEPIQRVKDGFPPDAESLGEGMVFFAVQIKEMLKKLYMFCDRDMTVFAPAFRNLQPTFNYNSERQKDYMLKLGNLVTQRDKNVISILQDAESKDLEEDTKAIFSGLFFCYQSLKEVLPPEKAKKDLEAVTTAIRTTIKKADKINYPVDKVNNNVWDNMEHTYEGQLQFSTLKTGKEKEVTVLAAINFDNVKDVKISKKLGHFDKRVYIATASLWNAGNKNVTLSKIHETMGNTKRPSKNQIAKINTSITKMATARLYLDNIIEAQKSKNKYKKFKYDGALLPMKRISATVRGQLSEAVIHLFEEPPLVTFARERNQITTFDVKLLQSPIRKTDANIALDDYLIERISGAKQSASKGNKLVINSILFETVFQKLGIINRVEKARTIKKITTLFEHYKKSKYIKKYVKDEEKVTFYF